jgi:putative transposase
MRYHCIQRRSRQYAIRMMCRLLKVSRSGYYDWVDRGESKRAQKDRELSLLICELHKQSDGVYGARKLHHQIKGLGHSCGRHKVARIMRQAGIKGYPKRRFRRYEKTTPTYPIADNLLDQNFTAQRVNTRWSSDITYIATRQGWLYLAVVMDLYSRRIVGWSMNRRLSRHLAIDALNMALGLRQPKEALVHHSDRGAQYTSDDYRHLLQKHNIGCSMSGRGNCYDNAAVESFFSLLKRERARRKTYRTRDEARADIFDYIERFYNRKRLHGYLGYTSPMEYEARSMRA